MMVVLVVVFKGFTAGGVSRYQETLSVSSIMSLPGFFFIGLWYRRNACSMILWGANHGGSMGKNQSTVMYK